MSTNNEDDLKFKKKKIGDLVNYIKTRTENTPNYSLLLGAGCSISSGVSSGSQLVDIWRKELYCELFPEDDVSNYDVSVAKENLAKKFSSWYDLKNEYSSLFERKFDLPRQRRIFIEQQVSGKAPSIGYAYLVNLVKERYFNTVFTTNFDDLLNEAFYLYSDERPITCAHDSAISSITVTSARPKVIKLHGDYLYDDLKSTLRETESLEENMKNKLSEFAKDFGLIVIGYSGCDRSIMDSLNYLVKKEENYKNGIYWCTKKGAHLSNEVKKLLWRDRVYWLEVDGFDELTAEIHNALLSGHLPIEVSVVNVKSQKIVSNLIENSSGIKCDVIERDRKKLEENQYDALISALIKPPNEKQDDSRDASSSDAGANYNLSKFKKIDMSKQLLMARAHECYQTRRYALAIKILEDLLAGSVDDSFKIEINRMLFDCHLAMGDVVKAEGLINKIQNNTDEEYRFINLCSVKRELRDKIETIDKAIEINPYNSNSLLIKARFKVEAFEARESGFKVSADDVLEVFEDSLVKNPGLDNDAWDEMITFIDENFKVISNPEEILNEICINVSKQNPNSFTKFFSEIVLKRINKCGDEEIEKYILENIKRPSIQTKTGKLIEYYAKSDRNTLIIFENLSKHKDNIKKSIPNLLLLSDLSNNKFNDVKFATKCTELAISIRRSISALRMHCRNLMHDGRYDEAIEILKREEGAWPNRLLFDIYVEKNDFILAEKACNELLDSSKVEFITLKSFLLLKQNKPQQAMDFIKDNYDFSKQIDCSIIVNYEIARKKLSKNLDQERMKKARISAGDNMLSVAAIETLSENFAAATKLIQDEFKKDNSVKYRLSEWVVFQPLLDQLGIREIKNSAPKSDVPYFDILE